MPDDERHRQFHGDRQQKKNGEEDAEDLLGKAPGAVHAVRLDLLGEKRHEGRIERPFGKKPAEGVRQPEGGVEGIGDRAGAECGRHEGFPDEAEEPASERCAADGSEFLDQTHVSAFVVLEPWGTRDTGVGAMMPEGMRSRASSTSPASTALRRAAMFICRFSLVIFEPTRSVT